MAQRLSLFQLCKKFALSNDMTIQQFTPIIIHCDSSRGLLTFNLFSRQAKRFKSTKIISDLHENKDAYEFSEDIEVEDDFFIDPVTKKGLFRSDMDREQLRFPKSSERLHNQYEGDHDKKFSPRFKNSREFPQRQQFRDDRTLTRSSSRINSFRDINRMDSRRELEDLWNELNNKKIDFSDTSFTKDIYKEHPHVTNRTEADIRQFFEEHQITISGGNQKKPILKFCETHFSDDITTTLKRMKFEQPTPIQSVGWPHALSGNDIVGIAQTGSGKTLSFILPAISHIHEQRKKIANDGPIALVVCPTRELAMQCQDVVRNFGMGCKINSVCVYGGQSKLIQEDQLIRPNLDLVIATPGRLLDFLTMEVISLRHCSFVVLDEADRMLDMGFEPQIRSVMGQIRPDRQVLMWSATWPEEIQDLASEFLNDYIHLKIGSQEYSVNADITHEFHYCMGNEKLDLLLDHLVANRNHKNPRHCAKTLVFCSTKSQCSRLQGILRREGFYVDSIHGDKSQLQRDTVMRNFRSGRISLLIASDVAARGLDVSDIEYVVNYDLPSNIDNYIHRVGRTARAGKKGKAVNFMTIDDLYMTQPLIKVLEDVGHEIPDVLHSLNQKRMKLKSLKKRNNIQNRSRQIPGRNKYRY